MWTTNCFVRTMFAAVSFKCPSLQPVDADHHDRRLFAEHVVARQSSGVSQVGASVNELDQMTQQNATLVEQTAAASSALKDQALAAEVARFRLPGAA